jgi:hypothetical protein
MKSLWVAAALLLLANNALAEVPELQENLQQILDDRSAELDRRFEVRLNKLLDATTGPSGQSLEVALEEFTLGDQPSYFAWHLAR